MLKNILKIVLNAIVLVILFLLQFYVFNNIYIFGARFNVIVVYCITVAMLNSIKVSMPLTFLVGLMADIFLGNGKLQYLLVFMVIAIVLESLKLIYKQDSSMSVAIYTTAGIIVLEIATAIFSAISKGVFINIFTYAFFVIKALVLNIPLSYLMYYIAVNMNEKLEK